MNTTANPRRQQADEFLWVIQTTFLRHVADVLKTDRVRGFKKAVQYSGSGRSSAWTKRCAPHD
jgi:hypothetical protein